MNPITTAIVAALLLECGDFTAQLLGAVWLNANSNNVVDLSKTDRRLTEFVRRHQALESSYDNALGRINAIGKAGDLQEMIGLAREIERDWGSLQSDYSAPLFGATAAGLVQRFRSTPEAVSLAIRLGDAALDRIGGPGLPSFQNYALGGLTGGPNSDPLDPTKAASLLDRVRILDAELFLFQMATTYVSVPLADQLKPFENRVSRNALNFTPHLDGEQLQLVVNGIENEYRYEDLKYQYKFLTETNSVYGAPRLELYPRQIGRFVRARFDRSVEDLKQVRRSLQSRITDPLLREKLMTAIYGSENPFLALPEDSVGAGGGPSLEALTRKSAAAGHGPQASGGSHGTSASASDTATSGAAPSTSPRSLPYLPLAGVLAAGVVLWWFLSRSRPS